MLEKKDSLLPGFYFQLFCISMQGAYMPCCKRLVFLYDVSFFFPHSLNGLLTKTDVSAAFPLLVMMPVNGGLSSG